VTAVLEAGAVEQHSTFELPAERRGARWWTDNRWILALFLVLYSLINVMWIWHYRHGQAYDIDESGYLTFSFTDYSGLGSGGLWGWIRAVLGPSIQAPLTLATSSGVYVVFGPKPIAGMLVPAGFGTLTIFMTFMIGRHVGGLRCAWLATVVVAGAPIVLGYSRSYNFAITATAMFTTAIWFLIKSDGLLRTRSTAAFGLFIGLTALARTMMLAFLPSLAVAAVVIVVVNPGRIRRLANLALATAFAFAVALPWYVPNGHAVYDYLTSFGYGSRSAEFGAKRPLFSLAAWHITALYLVSGTYLPLLILLIVAVVVLVLITAWQVRVRGVREMSLVILRSPLLILVIVIIEGLVAVTSSRNKGSGFLTPLLPAMILLAAWTLTYRRYRIGSGLALMSAAVAVLNFVAMVDLSGPLARPRNVNLPRFGSVTMLDGRSPIEHYESDGEPELQNTAEPVSRSEGEAWIAANDRLAALLRVSGGSQALTALGFRHRLYNPNSIGLQESVARGPALPVMMIETSLVTNSFSGYVDWLQTGEAATVCNLVLADGVKWEIPPLVDYVSLRTAALASGFVQSMSWTLPDGRNVTFLRRLKTCP
jgi:4-amino-4-deoxy-L-arabinose transferase-like glycosyltransferase